MRRFARCITLSGDHGGVPLAFIEFTLHVVSDIFAIFVDKERIYVDSESLLMSVSATLGKGFLLG